MVLNVEIIGVWIAVFLTLCIFSFLYKDNPFYKSAEHIFVGISAGYAFTLSFWDEIVPNLFGRLWPSSGVESNNIFNTIWYYLYEALGVIFSGFGLFDRTVFPEGGMNRGYDSIDFWYLIPFALGIFMLFRLIPKLSWLARISIAYSVGIYAGLKLYAFMNSSVLEQIKDTSIDLTKNSWGIFEDVIIIVGVISSLVYFYFSKEQKGVIGKISKIGIYFLMIKFGASFGFTVMGRITLLIGRFEEMIEFSKPSVGYATPIILVFILVSLGLWSYFYDSENTKKKEID